MTDGAIATRPATPADGPFLRAVYAASRADELAATGWDQTQVDAFIDMQFAAQDDHYRKHYDGARFDVIECGAEPIGRLYVHETDTRVTLMDIALLPAWRGRGIGGALIADLIDDNDRTRRRPMDLHVERHNPAMRLYRRLGFQEVEERGFYVFMVRPGACAVS